MIAPAAVHAASFTKTILTDISCTLFSFLSGCLLIAVRTATKLAAATWVDTCQSRPEAQA
jgi:hypothetical protein